MVLLPLCACRKDVDDFKAYAPSTQDLGNLLAEQVPSPTTKTNFTLNLLAADTVLETPNGTLVHLIDTDDLFMDAQTGSPVFCSTCNDLTLEVTEILNKRDIVARGLHTVGDNNMLFESGGMVRVNATCNGRQLALLTDRTIKVLLPNANPQPGYFVFAQAPNPTEPWQNSQQEVFEAEWHIAGGEIRNGYEVLVKKMGWSACGKTITDPQSGLCIELPAGFADQNTLAYIVFKNQSVVVPLQYSLSGSQFCFPNVPEGFQVQLVAMSKLGGQYWLGKEQTEIGINPILLQMGTQEITEVAVINFIKSL